MTDHEIDIQMQKAVQKVPFEMKKIKFILCIVKIFKELKRKLHM